MKIINNAKKYGLPPRHAILNLATDTLHVYASEKGLSIGIHAAVRNASAPCGFGSLPLLVVFKRSGCVWDLVGNADYLGSYHHYSDRAAYSLLHDCPSLKGVLGALYDLSFQCFGG